VGNNKNDMRKKKKVLEEKMSGTKINNDNDHKNEDERL
jgi:hypothetical protein